MNKIIKPLLVVAASAAMITSLTGCKRDRISKDPNTINIRLYKAGYGDEFIYTLKDKFEQVFATEGYKVNILTPSYDSAGDVVLTELSQGYKKTGIDLYITGAINPNMVSPTGQYGELVEDIEEIVYNQTSINYDGREGAKVCDKINKDYEEFLRSDAGTMYGFAWAQSTAGLVVNSKKLKSFGINELPRTTNEFLADCETIYNAQTGVLPITYTVGFTGYSDCAFDSWFSQLGIQKFREFYRMQTYDGSKWNDMSNGYEVFNDADIKDVLYNAYRFMDINFAANGSTTQKLDQAQAKIMKSGQDSAVFMFNGDWFLNEIKLNYRGQLDEIEFINVPVISKVGQNIFGTGTVHNKSDADCDKLLSYACGLVDQNKTKQEIHDAMLADKGVDMSDADVTAICDARGSTYARGPEHQAFITKNSTKAHIASKFLRMMASDDYAETFMETSNCSTPYASHIKTTSQYKFVNEAKEIALNIYNRPIRGLVRGLRNKVGINTSLPGIQYASQYIANQAISKYDGSGGIKPGSTDDVYWTAATSLFNKAYKDAKSAWETYNK